MVSSVPVPWVAPVVLEGSVVRLEPMTSAHAPELAAVGLDPELWRWIPTPVTSLADMETYVASALAEQARGTALPFVLRHRSEGRLIGSTRFAAIEPAHLRLEIGWTWVTPAHQRSAVNTEAKRLLLTHAFETLGANRVELKTDALNARSRAAILRLGATEEGVLRRHVRTAAGRWRDTVYFSILAEEWPEVKARLEATGRS